LAQIGQDIAVVAQDVLAVLALDVDLQLVVVTVKERRGDLTNFADLLDGKTFSQPRDVFIY